MHRILCLLFAVAVSTCSCGKSNAWMSSYGRGEPSAAYPAAEPVSGAYVIVPADHRVFMVQITSEQEGLQAQLRELLAARDALRKAVEPLGGMTGFQVGDPEVTGRYPVRKKDSRTDRNAVMVRVTFKQPADPLKQAADFAKAVAGIKPPAAAKWTYELKGIGCLLREPEKYREQLVAKAMSALQGFRGVDGSRFRLAVTGLEKPLAAAQYSDTEFIVSLPYSITVESVSEPPAQTPPKPAGEPK